MIYLCCSYNQSSTNFEVVNYAQKSKYGKNGRKDSQKFRLSLRPFMLHWNSAIHSNNAAPESSNLMD